MNYWPAEVTNLPEMHLPLFDLIASLVEPGSKTVRVQYGADGWVVHPMTSRSSVSYSMISLWFRLDGNSLQDTGPG